MNISRYLLKYYHRQLLINLARKSIYLLIFDIFYILTALYIEDKLYLTPMSKSLILFGFLGVNILILGYYLVFLLRISRKVNLTKLSRFGERLSSEESLKDVYLNYLELKFLGSSHLALAAANQKEGVVERFDFGNIINLRQLKIPFVLLLCFILIYTGVYFLNQQRFSHSIERLVNYNIPFAKPAICTYSISPVALDVNQYEDFKLTVYIESEFKATDLFVSYNGNSFHAAPNNDGSYSYVFQKVDNDIRFKLNVNFDEIGQEFVLKVYNKPLVARFSTTLNYPAYLNMKPDVFVNKYSFIAPAYTSYRFALATKYCGKIQPVIDSTTILSSKVISDDPGNYTFDVASSVSFTLKFLIYSIDKLMADTIIVSSKSLPDDRPGIYVTDISHDSLFYFKQYRVNVYDDNSLKRIEHLVLDKYKNILFKNMSIIDLYGVKSKEFDYSFNFNSYFNQGRDTLYTLWLLFDANPFRRDTVKSQMFTISKPQKKQMLKELDDLSEELAKLSNKSKSLNTLQKSLKTKLRNDSLAGDFMKMERISEEQKLQNDILNSLDESGNKLEDISKQFKQVQEMDSTSREILEKKEENLNKILDQIKEKMEKLEKQGFFDEKRKQEEKKVMDLADLALEQQKNLLKQLDQALKLQAMIDSLGKADKLNSEVLQKGENLNTEQKDRLFKQAKDLVKEVEQSFNEMNKKELKEEAVQKADEALEDLQKSLDKPSKDGEQQEKAKDVDQKIDNAQQELNDMLNSLFEQELELNIEKVKKLIKHINNLSFFQEDNFLSFNAQKRQNQLNPKILSDQHLFNRQFEVFRDSLLNFLKSGMVDVVAYVEASDKVSLYKGMINTGFKNRNYPDIEDKQQRTLGVMNQISLMLSENLEDFSRMQPQSSGGMCSSKKKKKGKSGAKLSNLTKQQQKLNKGSQQQSMGQPKPGQQKPGSKEGKEGKEGSEARARLAAEQYEIRKAVQDLMNETGDKGLKELLKDAGKKMEAIENDLINRAITPEMLARQQEIETRLLEAEKAERMQEMDNQRKSTEFKDEQSVMNLDNFKVGEINSKENRLVLKPDPIKLRTYYRKYTSSLKTHSK